MNIRNALIASASTLTLSALATGAMAAGSLNASAVSSVTVVSPTTLTKTQDMAFGTVVRPSGANGNTTFALDTGDTVTKTGGDGTIVASTTTSAKFNLTTVAQITFSTTQVLTFAPAGLINVSATAPLVTGGLSSTQVGANSTATLTYGGQFDVTPTTTPQTYTGTLAVTVSYN
jgi:Domain of unknown function (DUF4402)